MTIKYQELTGRKFNLLLVLEEDKEKHKNGNHFWKCLCDCGNIVSVETGDLNSEHKKSCGCLRHKPMPKHVKDILSGVIKKKNGEASFNALYSQYKCNAKRKNRKFDIDKENFKSLTSSPCHYCGSLPSQFITFSSMNGKYLYNGLDRINQERDYTIDNVVPCCKYCNFAKHKSTYKEFQDYLLRVAKFYKNQV